jgi:hypothetical protein
MFRLLRWPWADPTNVGSRCADQPDRGPSKHWLTGLAARLPQAALAAGALAAAVAPTKFTWG